MSAYAALVSLREILVTILYGQPWISSHKGQLQILLAKVDLLLNFLDNSSSISTHEAIKISALETKMRDAAYKAEDLIEFGILDSESRMSYSRMRSTFFYCICNIVVLLSGFLLLNYAKLEAIPAWIVFILESLMNAVFSFLYFREIPFFSPLNDSQQLRLVLYDFEIIVNQVKEARGEAEMSAHAALLSLQRILDSILDSGEKNQLRSLQEMVIFLLDFLGNASTTYMLNQNLDETIRHSVSKAKRALIEFQIPRKFSLEFEWRRFSALQLVFPTLFAVMIRIGKYYLRTSTSVMTPSGITRQLSIALASYLISVVVAFVVLVAQRNSEAPENQELPRVIDDFSIIVIKIKDACGNTSDLLAAAAAAAASSSRQNSGGTRKDVVVGLDSDLIKMKGLLLQDSSRREVASIVGMGGIGKTTLARQVFKDPDIYNHFDVCAWVTVSREYSFRHVLLRLLDSAHMLTEENRQDNEETLELYLHKNLMYRRYLIVMDDVWDTQIWDMLSKFFPENNNGSRIILTSRFSDVASYSDSGRSLHHMQCLNENESWNLLREKAFGEEGCPLELESIGREIATSCSGLPLAIVVVGGLLYKESRIMIWRDVAKKLKKSELQDIKEQCLEILGLSYNHLPHRLRPCFLYMGVLPRDYEIPISRLVNLWVAEGFLEPSTSKTLEEVAEVYLEDLIDRNLILVCKKSCNGKMRTCSMHDLLRDVCVQKARDENFIHVVDSEGYVTGERSDCSPRRLSVHNDALQVVARHDSVRSVLCIASKPIENPLVVNLGFQYLRVLDVLEVHFGQFPHQITILVRLRYLALYYDGSLPPSIATLQNLETIVHHHSSFRKYPLLPRVIWKMPNLRHLYVKPGCYLFNSLGYLMFPLPSFLRHLQTLVGIRNFKWSEGIIERIPNLKKLGISYGVPSSVDWSTYQLDSLVDLHQLEALKIIIKYIDPKSTNSCDPPKFAFPQKLKKLSLSGCRIPWASMTAIGALPDLEALKLRCEAFSGPSWETVEGEFSKLMFLLLEEMSFTSWETADSHFPRLQRLIIRSCVKLKEIPSSIGDIPTLEKIQLDNCRASAVASANEIQEEQESMGNEVKLDIEQGRREVDEMNLENLEAEGVGPGVLQVVRDAIQIGELELTLILQTLGVLGLLFVFGNKDR